MLTSFQVDQLQEAWSGEESLSFHGAGVLATHFPGPHRSGWPQDFILEAQGSGLSLKALAFCLLWRQTEDRNPETEIKEKDEAWAQEKQWKDQGGLSLSTRAQWL